MRKLMVLLLLFFLPLSVSAEEKKHIKTSADQECSDCHLNQAGAWQDGKHGLMNVKCVVCHGSPEENFIARPGVDRCLGCHGEQVEQSKRTKVKTEKKCFPCHDPHSLAVKNQPEKPFHSKGGN